MAFFNSAIPSSTRAPSLFTYSVRTAGGGIRILHLLVHMLLVVVGAQFGVVTERERPIDYPNPVVGLGIVWLQFNVLLMVHLGLFEFLGVKGRAGHLEENRADAIDGGEIVRINPKDLLVFGNRLFAEPQILRRGRSGYVLAGVRRGQIEPRVHQ